MVGHPYIATENRGSQTWTDDLDTGDDASNQETKIKTVKDMA